MKPATALTVADALELLAKALREEAAAPQHQAAMSLSVAAKERGYSVSTLSELLRSRQVEGIRRGRGRGRWYVTGAALDAYEKRRTSAPRPALLRDVS